MQLDVDVTGLELNHAIHVSDLPHSGSIKFLGDESATVALVAAIRAEAEPAAEEVAAAAAGEPEVAKKGKTDAETPAADAKKK